MRSETTQCSSLIAALLKVRTGMVLQNYNIRGTYVVFKVNYLLNGWVKKDGVNANLVLNT